MGSSPFGRFPRGVRVEGRKAEHCRMIDQHGGRPLGHPDLIQIAQARSRRRPVGRVHAMERFQRGKTIATDQQGFAAGQGAVGQTSGSKISSGQTNAHQSPAIEFLGGIDGNPGRGRHVAERLDPTFRSGAEGCVEDANRSRRAIAIDGCIPAGKDTGLDAIANFEIAESKLRCVGRQQLIGLESRQSSLLDQPLGKILRLSTGGDRLLFTITHPLAAGKGIRQSLDGRLDLGVRQSAGAVSTNKLIDRDGH
jgi:hypothetical protein